MYMLILLGFLNPMDFKILVNYVYVDSNESYNTWKLRTCWFYWVFECLQTMCMLIPLGFWMLINYEYVDSNRFFEYLQPMYMLIPMNLIILENYVYVDSTGFWMLVNYVCWFNWGLEYL